MKKIRRTLSGPVPTAAGTAANRGWLGASSWEALLVLGPAEGCSYSVQGCLQSAFRARSRRQASRLSGLTRVEATTIVDPAGAILAAVCRPDPRVFAGDGHYACEAMAEWLAQPSLDLVGRLRLDACSMLVFVLDAQADPGYAQPVTPSGADPPALSPSLSESSSTSAMPGSTWS